MRVAIVGAGLAGLSAARDLATAGHEVVVFEKSRGAGGRTSTRRSPHGRFDHGAPFLHDGAEALGLDAAPALVRHQAEAALSVGAPAGNAPAKALAEGLDLRFGVRVGAITSEGSGWALTDAEGGPLGSADAVIVSAPAPQAAELLPDPDLAAQAASVDFAPCWVAMAAWDEPLDGAIVEEHPRGLAWAVAEATKSGREPGERWVLQADAELSTALLEVEADTVAAELLTRFGVELPAPVHLAAHRWRHARPLTPLPELFLRAGTLLAAGDWCGGTDAGAALRSGRAAAAELLS